MLENWVEDLKNTGKPCLKRKMLQVDLATALSVDRAYISNIENGRMNPTLYGESVELISTLEKIARALGIFTS